MIQKSWTLAVFALALILVLAVTGCGSAPPTPTRAAPTQPPPPPQVVTVVVTPTSLPPTATLALPTITPIPTVAITTAVPAPTTAAVKPTAAPVATKAGPTATRRPTTPAAPVVPAATNTVAVALKYAAPRPISPIYDESIGRKDERHYPADVLRFEWTSVGSLQGNECYQIRVDFVPGQGDTFLQCDASATQVGAGAVASFTLNKPNQAGPNYSALIPTSAGESNVNWSVQVVRDDGKGTVASDPSGARHNTTPLSPKSSTVKFLLKGG